MKNKIENFFRRSAPECRNDAMREKINLIITLLVGSELAKLKKAKRNEIMAKMQNLEEAEMEVNEMMPSSHGTRLGSAEAFQLAENEKCPADFLDFCRLYGQDAPPEEYDSIIQSELDFLMGLPPEERKKMAEKRHGKTAEEYYLEYLLENDGKNKEESAS